MKAQPPQPPAPPASASAPRRLLVHDNRISSRELLDERGQLIIEHQGRSYQLRETRNGKLILTS